MSEADTTQFLSPAQIEMRARVIHDAITSRTHNFFRDTGARPGRLYLSEDVRAVLRMGHACHEYWGTQSPVEQYTGLRVYRVAHETDHIYVGA